MYTWFDQRLLSASGGAVPPVCRLLNHSQVSFEAKVKERKAEKKQHENRRISTIKEVSTLLHTAACLQTLSRF